MAELNYPQAEDQIRAHDRFREELAELTETPAIMDSTLQESLSLFLSKWLRLHVFGIDKYFETFVLKSKFK